MPCPTPEELPVRFAAAINRGDLAGALELWSDDPRILPVDGRVLAGSGAIEGALRALIDSGTRIEIQTRSLHVAGDVALATGRLGMRAADGGELSSEAIAVYARAPDGHWRIAIDLPWGLPAAAEDGSHHSSPSRQSHVSSPSGSSATATSST